MKAFWQKLTREKMIAWGLDLLVAVLLFGVLFQCGLYLRQYARSRRGESDMPFDMRMLSVSVQEGDRPLDSKLLLPCEIALCSAGDVRAVVNSSLAMEDLYGKLSPLLRSAFETAPAVADADAWRAAVLASDVIYIGYHGMYPYQVIHAFLGAGKGGDGYVLRSDFVDVQELCLLFSNGEVTLFTRGSSGVHLFRTPYEGDMLEYLSYADGYRDVFYECQLTDAEIGAAVVLTERVETRDIEVIGGIPALLYENEEQLLTTLYTWQFNPDKLNYYTEPDGATVYVESHGVLWHGEDRVIYTAAENGGVPVDEFAVPQDRSIYTYLKVASSLLSSLSAMDARYTGGDASLRLVSVTAKEDSVVLKFGLFLDNLPVYVQGDTIAFSMTFQDSTVTEMVWRPMLVQKGLGTQNSMFEVFAQSVLESANVRLAYRVEGLEETTGAQWVAYRQREA